MSASLDVKTLTVEQLAKTIDHSLLRPELTEHDVIEGCRLAKQYHVASVCVRPCDVPLAVSEMQGSDVKVGTVVGFPHGNTATVTKAFEARQAVADGAQELDMVMNIGALRSGRYDYVENDIRAVVEAAGEGIIVKVILENCYLTDEEKVKACQLAESAGADFVKTSTGFAASGATIEDLKLMRASVGPHVNVKAAHGVRTLEAALQVIEAGATRFGATRTKKILDDFESSQKGGKG
ncbi:MAG: deoxyribose-phosphate aldolase [Anaerolineae bacterium]|nr:deoxyribose-phosphate aldolase [Anaerolineae bacterium]